MCLTPLVLLLTSIRLLGHHNGDIVGKTCAKTGRSVREVVLEMGLLTESELDDILSVDNLMCPTYKAKLMK